MEDITPNEVKDAALATGKTWFPVRDCSLCGSPVGYRTLGERVGFDSNCGCSSRDSGVEERTWDDPARLINMQTLPEWRNKMRAVFGLDPEES